jgi:hypothetical protein
MKKDKWVIGVDLASSHDYVSLPSPVYEKLIEELNSLRKCYEITNKSWIELATENTSLKQEIERLREIILIRGSR